ncbi:MAG: hypothetical protein L6305_08500 [Actinomycetia bacterium]|nr:hypothetical protein [Actinomycetota bacterium]MCG2791768.1 hypothetical protein [Actinomycetes bacterium]
MIVKDIYKVIKDELSQTLELREKYVINIADESGFSKTEIRFEIKNTFTNNKIMRLNVIL